MRIGTTGTGVFAGLLVGIVLLAIGGSLSQAQTPTPPPDPPADQLTGDALAASLGLQIQPSMPPGCEDYVVVREGGAGYCLQGHVEPGLESWDVGRRLAGIVPSDLDRQLFALVYEHSQLSQREDPERLVELEQQISELMEQRSAHDGN